MYQETNQKNVLIVDDHKLIISGLKVLLSGEGGLNILPGVGSGEEALDLMSRVRVDIVLADINMPGMSGIELIARVGNLYPNIRVIGFSMHNHCSVVQKVLSAGAWGFVLKSDDMSQIYDALFTVARGGKYLSSEAQAVIMKDIYHKKPSSEISQSGSIRLTSREKRILELFLQQKTSAEISNELLISQKILETHCRNIFVKTRTRSLVELIKNGRKILQG
jgi:DNA-binding NarL/FixJ family response regulator